MKSRLIKISFFAMFAYYLYCLPENLFHDPFSTVIYSKEGQLLTAQTAKDGQWRFPETTQAPEKFSIAIKTFEDARFNFHPGVDPIAIGRAILQNFKQKKVVSGGSTLTMQLIRMSRKGRARNMWQKGIEAILATRAEIRYSKNEILALYASHAPFGGNVVGLDAASWRYYGKKSADLSWAESSLMAVLPNAPALIHPGKNRKKLLEKRNRLLEKLYKNGDLDKLEFELSLLEPIPEKPQKLPLLARHLINTNNYGKALHSSLSYSFQERIEKLVDYHHAAFKEKGIKNSAIVVVENLTGNVISYVGNTRGRSNENAVDMIKAARSSGSILKPFLYALAIDEGIISPDQLLEDSPISISGFNPKNYNKKYSGMTKASAALARSLNVPAVNLLQKYGVEKFRRDLIRLGITTLPYDTDHYGLSLILGGAEVSLWDLVKVYSCMAQKLNQYGKEEKIIREISVEKEKVVRSIKLSDGSIFTTFEAMKKVIRPDEDGFWETFSSSRPLAWKTGTSYGHRDAWAVGINPEYTIGVWVGNSDGEGNIDIVGSSAAGSLLFDVLNVLPQNSQWFTVPHDDLIEVPICRLSGHIKHKYCLEWDALLLPQASIYTSACPYHKQIFLSEDAMYQVNRSCTDVMIDTSWFILPPTAGYYYRQSHPSYKKLPAFSEDCKEGNSKSPLELVFPSMDEHLYLPTGLDGKKKYTVFKAMHTDMDKEVYWHLDGKYIGMTKEFHQKKIWTEPGQHRLVITDSDGYNIIRSFIIVGTETAAL